MKVDPQSKFTCSQIEEIVDFEGELKLPKEALKRVGDGAAVVAALATSEKPIYGVNTGFGRLASVKISPDDLEQLQVNILRSHASGIGNPSCPRVVRRLLFLRMISLGKGHSGIRPEFVTRHLEYLNHQLCPWIPEQGSVGASGDLAPLSHLGLTFLGEGGFLEAGKQLSAKKILNRESLKPLDVRAKEGLALTNGTQFSTALALEALRQLKELLPWAEWASCLSIESHQATSQTFRADLHRLKEHPHQRAVAKRIFSRLRGSEHIKGHKDCDRVQDAYSFRCIPQVMGPVLSVVDAAEKLIENEANSVSDNPVVSLDKKELISGGHFHAQSVSLASDMLCLAMATAGNLIERRIDQLVNPLTNRSKGFLADEPGVESGFMIVHTAAAALASENKTLAHPASADSIPTNGNQEDHVSMASWAGRKAIQMVTNLRRIVAGEILCAVRGCLFEQERTQHRLSDPLENLLAQFEKDLPKLFRRGDRVFADDWREVESYIQKTTAPE